LWRFEELEVLFRGLEASTSAYKLFHKDRLSNIEHFFKIKTNLHFLLSVNILIIGLRNTHTHHCGKTSLSVQPYLFPKVK
jgi:uncharacterized membrane protein YiaA